MAVNPPSNPGEAFGAGDPRNAAYFQTLANLEHQYQTTLASDKQRLGSARSNAQYQQGLYTQREPGTYRANQHRANAGGIAESGVNAERRGSIGQDYANKRFSVTHGLQETEGQISQNEQQAKEGLELGRSNAAQTALSEGYRSLLEREPNETAGRTVEGPAGPGGVVPYTAKTPGGSVRVGAGYSAAARPRAAPVRTAAAKNYLAMAKRKARI